MSIKNEFDILGLEPGASPKLISDTYRNLSKDPASEYRHPDVGGTADKFYELVHAYTVTVVYAYAERCPLCDGSGVLNHRKGFAATQVTCSTCKGSGKRYIP